jgi:hypothetical protein
MEWLFLAAVVAFFMWLTYWSSGSSIRKRDIARIQQEEMLRKKWEQRLQESADQRRAEERAASRGGQAN